MFSINVTAQEIEIGPHLLKYSQYAKFHEKNPFFEIKNQQKNGLRSITSLLSTNNGDLQVALFLNLFSN